MKNETNLTPEMLAANPMVAIALALFGLLVMLLLVASLATWSWACLRWSNGKPLLIVEAWRPRAWGLFDLFLAGGLVMAGQIAGFRAWAAIQGIEPGRLRDDGDSLGIMAVGSASLLCAMGMMILWLLVRYSRPLRHFGLSLSKLPSRVVLGLGAAAMWLPVVMAIMALVSLAFKREYDHPLIERLNAEGTVQAYLLAVFSAVAVAPLVEEFLFRVLLQGWLQSLPWSVSSRWWFAGAGPEQKSSPEQRTLTFEDKTSEPHLDSASEQPADNPYQPPLQAAVINLSQPPIVPPQLNTIAGEGSTANGSERLTLPTPGTPGGAEVMPPIWPVFVSGTLFGLAHFDYGLSFVPLIILGIILGFLYRATHSIWPCVVLHFSLNSFSMIGLGLGLLVESIR